MTLELQRLIAEAGVLAGGEHPCDVLGHKWKHFGGAQCACDQQENLAGCSVPVYVCEACGDCDYGDNAEARETRNQCEKERKEAHG